jgi:hypothetical protein
LCFTLLAAALIMLDGGVAWIRWTAEASVHLVGGLLLLVASGFAFDSLVLAGVTSLTAGMAIPTLTLFLFAGTGVLALRPDRGLFGVLLAPGASGVIARRLIPIAAVLPLLGGWAAWEAHRQGVWPEGFAFAVFAIGLTVILVSTTWRAVTLIATADSRWKQALTQLQQAQVGLEDRVQERTKALRLANDELRRGRVARHLANRVLLHGHREMSAPSRRGLGRTLAQEETRGTLEDHLAAFADMGAGTIALTRSTPDRWHFSGEDLIEVTRTSKTPTCALALGYLEGTIEHLQGAPALGTEVNCRSQGARACEFVVMTKSPADEGDTATKRQAALARATTL